MKPTRVATPNAGKTRNIFKYMAPVLMIILVLCITSCDQSDDLESIIHEPPTTHEPPEYNEPPAENESVIVYTDIEPDFSSKNLNDSFDLDLNNDELVDFSLRSSSEDDWEWLGIVTKSNSGNGIISIAPWGTYSVPLPVGKEIFKLSGYGNGEYYDTGGMFYIAQCSGDDDIYCFYFWTGETDQYLGLRFNKNGQTHYGWARLEVVSVTQWVIKDYAYNATPDKPIKAGQKT